MRVATFLAGTMALLPGMAAAQAVDQPQSSAIAGTRLTVSADGRVSRAPDLVTISAGVTTQADSAAAALSGNAAAMTRTLAALRTAGVAARDIQTNAISLQPQYRYGENVPPVITGYQAANQVRVRFRDVSGAGRILDALVAAGVNQIDGPNFALADPDAALDEARTQAVGKARARAELYAKAAGLHVRRIVSIDEGGAVEPPRPMPMMMAKRGTDATPIAAGEQEQVVTLSVTFELG